MDMTFYAKPILEDEEVMEMRSPSTKAMFIVKSTGVERRRAKAFSLEDC